MKSVLGEVEALDNWRMEDVEEQEDGSEVKPFIPNERRGASPNEACTLVQWIDSQEVSSRDGVVRNPMES